MESQQVVVQQLGGWAWSQQLLTVRNKIVTKILKDLDRVFG
jgi:hypothetical protein